MTEPERYVTCVHNEIVSGTIGTCKLCDQKRQYNTDNPREAPKLIKRGRINGKSTLVVPILDGQPLHVRDDIAETAPTPEKAEPVEKAIPRRGRPPKTGTRGPYKSGKYLDEHREEILADRLAIGLRTTLSKWSIHPPTWWLTVRRWKKEGYDIQGLRGVEGHLGGYHAHRVRASVPEPEPEPKTVTMGGQRAGGYATCADCGKFPALRLLGLIKQLERSLELARELMKELEKKSGGAND